MPVECVNCKFWELVQPAAQGPAEGACHRFPPAWHDGTQWVRPLCLEGDWCGEFSPKEAA